MTTEPERVTPIRRHPCAVTADRLTDHLAEFRDYLTARDTQAIEKTITTLGQIADGER